jgi:hypothetical protein
LGKSAVVAAEHEPKVHAIADRQDQAYAIWSAANAVNETDFADRKCRSERKRRHELIEFLLAALGGGGHAGGE